jgi:uncharacterized protein YjiS (DUF1127 family)
MTANKPARPVQATRGSAAWRAVRRSASALKHINDEQLQMWEAFARPSK